MFILLKNNDSKNLDISKTHKKPGVTGLWRPGLCIFETGLLGEYLVTGCFYVVE